MKSVALAAVAAAVAVVALACTASVASANPAILNANGTPYLDGAAAHAEDHVEVEDGYFAAGGALGYHLATRVGAAAELGLRLSDSPWFFHGMIAGGDSGLTGDGGLFIQARVGVEARGCVVNGGVCAFAGADVGVDHDDAIHDEYGVFGGDTMETVSDSMIAVPRVGFDVGRDVRIRNTLEMPLFASAVDGAQRNGVQATASLMFAF